MVNFNESVSAPAGAFTLNCTTSGSVVFLIAPLVDATSFTINPTPTLANGETCTLTVLAAQVSDTDPVDPPQNMAANRVFTCTVDQAPTVASHTPANAAVNVAVNSNIDINFSELVNVTGVGAFDLDCTGSLNHAFTVVGTNPATTFTLDPTADLPIGAFCTVTVLVTQVTDNDAGDPPDNMALDYSFTFSTIDFAPSVTSVTPADATTQVSNSTTVRVDFSESVSAPAAAFTLNCTTSGNVAFGVTPLVAATSFTLTPGAALANGETCTLTVLANQIDDTDPVDPPDDMAADFVSTFVVDEPPTVTTTTPADNATGVLPNDPITVVSDEQVSVNNGSPTFDVDCTNSPNHPFTLAPAPGPDTTFVLTPTMPYPLGDTCVVTVIASTIADADAGDPPNTLDGNNDGVEGDNYIFDFYIDEPVPTVTTTTPLNAATNVPTSIAVDIVFSEAVNFSAGSFTFDCAPGGAIAFSLSPVSLATTVTLTPAANLPVGSTCTVNVIANQVSDADLLDPQDLMAADYAFSFTTDAPPAVAITTPTDNTSGVAVNSSLSITFNEAVNVTSDWFQLVCTVSGTRLASAPDVTVTGGLTTYNIDPASDFSNSEVCTVTVFAAQVTDTDPNDPPDNMPVDYVFDFSTEEMPPAVTTTTPANGAVDIAVDANFTVTFNEPVNVTANAFVLECPAGSPITVTNLTTSPATTFTLDPTTAMPISTLCQVTVVATEVTDDDANDPLDNMVADYIFTLTTAPTTDSAPTVLSTNPAPATLNVARDATISVTFSEPVMMTTASFNLSCTVSGTVAFTLSGSASDYILDPNVNLVSNEVCTVTVIATQVSDADAQDAPDLMMADYVFSFTTGTEVFTDPTSNPPVVLPPGQQLEFKDSDFVSKTADKFMVRPGETVIFTITFTNPKSIPLTQVVQPLSHQTT